MEGVLVSGYADAALLGDLADDLPIFLEPLGREKALGLEQNLKFAIAKLVHGAIPLIPMTAPTVHDPCRGASDFLGKDATSSGIKAKKHYVTGLGEKKRTASREDGSGHPALRRLATSTAK